jgi:hypothetical protein
LDIKKTMLDLNNFQTKLLQDYLVYRETYNKILECPGYVTPDEIQQIKGTIEPQRRLDAVYNIFREPSTLNIKTPGIILRHKKSDNKNYFALENTRKKIRYCEVESYVSSNLMIVVNLGGNIDIQFDPVINYLVAFITYIVHIEDRDNITGVQVHVGNNIGAVLDKYFGAAFMFYHDIYISGFNHLPENDVRDVYDTIESEEIVYKLNQIN